MGLFAFLFTCLAAPALAPPQQALALKIALEESADHPKGIEIPPDNQLNPAEPVPPKQTAATGQTPGGSAPAARSSAPSSGGGGGGGGASSSGGAPRPTPKYHDVFTLFKPIEPIFPLKAANVTANITNMLYDKAWSVYFSRYNAIGSYYIEGGKSIGVLKDFTGKFQFSRQLREQITANSMEEYSAKVFGIETKFSKRVTRASQGIGATSAINVNDNRSFSAKYQLNKQTAINYISDRNITRAMSSSPSRSINAKAAWSLAWAGKNDFKFTLIKSDTANRNFANNGVSRVAQTDAVLAFPITKNLIGEAALHFLNTRNIQSTGSTENRKTLQTYAATYKLSPSDSITYRFSTTDDLNQNSLLRTSTGSTDRDIQFQYAIFSWLNLKLQNTVGFNRTSGKNAARQGSFTIDHKKRKMLPGSTNVQIRRNLNRTGDLASPTSSDDYTMSINTPVTYFGGRLSLGHNYNLNQQRNISPGKEQLNVSVTRRYDAAIKIRPSLTISGNLNNAVSNSYTLPITSSANENNTFTESVAYTIKHPFSKKAKLFPTAVYSFTKTRNIGENVIPNPSENESIILKHAGVFAFKLKTWDGNYTLEKSVNKPKGGIMSRATTSKLVLSINDIMGFKMTGNYSISKQPGGSVGSGAFKASRTIRNKNTISVSYQFTKNQAEANRQNNTINRLFDIVLEMAL